MANYRRPVNALGLTKRQEYETLRQSLLNERVSFDAHYKELGDYFFPRRTRFWAQDRNKGDRRSQNIINATPRFAARTLQSGLHAGLTSPARPWMRLTTPDPDLADRGPVKAWLHTVTQRMLTVFARSNIYNTLPTLYGDLGVFGTAAMGVMFDQQELLRGYSYPIGSYCVGLDDRGVATTFLRDYIYTVRQLVGAFGRVPGTAKDIDWSVFSQTVKNAWDRGQYETPIEVTWLVTPNPDADPRKLYASERMPWHSCYFEKGSGNGTKRESNDGLFLSESGYTQFPVLVPRWDVTGDDTYGTSCPGMDLLGDAKGLQLLERRKAQAIDKALNPPLVGPTSLRMEKPSLIPGHVTYEDERSGGKGLRPIHEVRLEGVQAVAAEIQNHEYRINRGFYVDLFLMLATSDQGRGAQPITAREVEERHEEKLLALGPVLERMNDELLDPLVDRTFALMLEAGAIPPPPEELHDVELKVEYLSIMSAAQKLVGVVGQDRFLQSAVNLSERFPDVLHKVNVFQAIDDYVDMLGVNPKLVRSNDEAQASAQAAAQAQQQQLQAEQFQKMAAGAKSLGDTSLEGNSALRQVLDGAAA